LLHSDEVARALVEGGADPTREQSGKSAVKLALEHDRPAIAKLLGAREAGGLDVGPLRTALQQQTGAIPKSWYWPEEYWGGGGAKDVLTLEHILESFALEGAKSWNALAAHAQGRPAWIALALAELCRDALKPEPSSPFADTPRVVLGDLVVEGHLHLSGPLLVTGNLTVSGAISDSLHDSMLAVAGNVRAKAVFSDGEVWIGGDLDAEIVWGDYNDHSLRVGGDLRARALVNSDHDVMVRGAARVDHTLVLREDDEEEKARAVFVDGCFRDGRLDFSETKASFAKTGSVLRAANAPPPPRRARRGGGKEGGRRAR
jgi:hypothetical protein